MSLFSTSALAQRWIIEPSVSTGLTYTSNSLLGTAASAEPDTVFDLRPRIAIRGEGARLGVSGSFALTSVNYLNGTQSNRVLPEGDIAARLEAIEKWLYLEGSVRAAQTASDPFGVRPDSTSTSNTLTTTQGTFSPRIESAIGPSMRYRIRSDNTWSHDSGEDAATLAATGAAGYFGHHIALIEQDPKPFGWRLEAERLDTRFDDGVTAPLVTELARVTVDYTIAEDLSMGLRGGYERDNFVSAELDGHAIYGGQVKWQPSARTLVSAFVERRFFGTGGRLEISQRTPRFAFNLTSSRGIESSAQSLFELPATGNVAALLDAMFTTRVPDPAERARLVQKLITDQGLPSSTLSAINLRSQRLSLVTSHTVSAGYVGGRNSVVLSGFYARTEDLPNTTLVPTGAAIDNNVQYGTGLTYSHRLAMYTSLSATLDWSRIRGLDAAAPEVTRQRGIQVQLSLQPSSKTTALLGGRYRKVDSSVAVPGKEEAIFVGLEHRF